MGSQLGKLKNRRQVLSVAAGRVKCATPSLVLQMREHGADEMTGRDIPSIRIGYTVSRKVGNAVVRNRVKRRLRAAAEDLLLVSAARHRDYVLIGRRSAYFKSFPSILSDLETALKKLGAYDETKSPGDLPLAEIS